MTGFDLGLLTLKTLPYGAVDVCLLAPKGQSNWGILTYFRGKVNTKIFASRWSLVDSWLSPARPGWGFGMRDSRKRGEVDGLMLDSAAGGNEAKLTNQLTGCKLEYRIKGINASGESMTSNKISVIL